MVDHAGTHSAIGPPTKYLPCQPLNFRVNVLPVTRRSATLPENGPPLKWTRLALTVFVLRLRIFTKHLPPACSHTYYLPAPAHCCPCIRSGGHPSAGIACCRRWRRGSF